MSETWTRQDATAADVVKRLRAGFDSGRTRPLDWRREQLRRLEALLLERETELLDALAADLGKPAIEGYVTEIAFTRREIDFALAHLDEWVKPEKVAVPAHPATRTARGSSASRSASC